MDIGFQSLADMEGRKQKCPVVTSREGPEPRDTEQHAKNHAS